MPEYTVPEQLADLMAPLDGLTKHPENARVGDVEKIAESIQTNGLYRPIQVQRSTGRVLAGNHTFEALQHLGAQSAPVVFLDVSDAEARRIMLADNRTSQLGGYDDGALSSLLKATANDKAGITGTGYEKADLDNLIRDTRGWGSDSTGDAPAIPEPDVDMTALLGDPREFLNTPPPIPHTTTLDARLGPWRQRKVSWLGLGLTSHEGRDHGLIITSASGRDPQFYTQKGEVERRLGRAISSAEFMEKHYTPPAEDGGISNSGTSVFDPVLCELAYRWYCPPGGRILDPFAGGSVRGVTAALLGYQYTGVDLSARQVEANREQWAALAPDDTSGPAPVWVNADSSVHLSDPTNLSEPVDLVFSCPPYADLEKYSDDPADLSNLPYPEFRRLYADIIRLACDRLRPGGHAVWVIGDVRSKRTSLYRGLVPDTVEAFQNAGLDLTSDAALITPSGALRLLAGRQMERSRKPAKSHQNVLCFTKTERTTP